MRSYKDPVDPIILLPSFAPGISTQRCKTTDKPSDAGKLNTTRTVSQTAFESSGYFIATSVRTDTITSACTR